MLITPLAFIVFNRADITEKVFAAIRKAKPAKLYIIADGPRDTAEKIRTEAARAVTGQIDWACEPVRLYSDTHLGCRLRIVSGLNEVFAREKSAIILEDDCLPQKDFFEYCEILLNHYENDTRVGAIQGSALPGFAGSDGQKSCVFTRLGILRGWATWKRVWQNMDQQLAGWNPETGIPLLEQSFPGQVNLSDGLAHLFEKAKKGCEDWAPAFLFSMLQQQQFHIHPADNMVNHLGSGKLATHSHLMQSDSAIPTGPGWSHHHRAEVKHDAESDNLIFETLYHPSKRANGESLLSNVWNHLKKLIPA
jgi:hypothetical protein